LPCARLSTPALSGSDFFLAPRIPNVAGSRLSRYVLAKENSRSSFFQGGPMKELVESIARALVDHPDDVQVKSIEGSQATILELRVHKEDLGKVIGRQGRTAKAVRTLLGAAGVKLHKRFTLEIVED